MTTNFKLIELLNSRDVLSKISQEKINAVVAFRLSKIVKAVNEELAKFDEVRAELFKKYGVNNPETNESHILDENKEVFTTELNQLLFEDIELSTPTISLDSMSNVELTTVEMLAIEKFITE